MGGQNPPQASGAPTATGAANLLDPYPSGPPGLHPPRARAPSLPAVFGLPDLALMSASASPPSGPLPPSWLLLHARPPSRHSPSLRSLLPSPALLPPLVHIPPAPPPAPHRPSRFPRAVFSWPHSSPVQPSPCSSLLQPPQHFPCSPASGLPLPPVLLHSPLPPFRATASGFCASPPVWILCRGATCSAPTILAPR